MSSINTSLFKSATDEDIPAINREPEDFTTAAVRHDTALEFGGLIGKSARIINNDGANNCIVRLHSNQGTARVVPPSSELTITEWFTQIHIEPDAVAGAGQLELELARPEDAMRNGRR